MLIDILLRYLSGFCRIFCSAADSVALLRTMMKQDIPYRRLKREGDTVYFDLSEKGLSDLKKAWGDRPLPLTVIKRQGLPSLLRRYRRRPGIAVGALLFLFLTLRSGEYIWDMRVLGTHEASDGEIIETLNALGCGIGSRIGDIDFEMLCHRYLLADDSVSFISVNMKGTVAEIELRDRVVKEESHDNGTPSNLIARRDGVIYRFQTSSGQTEVKQGQTVKKGQLLVSGIVSTGQYEEDSGFVIVRAKGAVYAVTNRCFSVSVPLKTVIATEGPEETLEKELIFFGKTVKLRENSSILPKDCAIIERRKRIVLFERDPLIKGIPLPVYIVSKNRVGTEEKHLTLTGEEALSLAEKKMGELVAGELADGELLSCRASHSVLPVEGEDALVLVWEISCIENIAEEVPIGLS